MNIVILDGHTANPGDLTWEAFEKLGSCSVYDRTAPEEVLERAAGAQVVLTNKVKLTAEIIDQLPALEYIGVLATGVNVVDLEAARARDIPVTNVPAYSTSSVAQMVFALLFELTRQVGRHAALVREGRWSASPDFCFWEGAQVELDGLTLGIVGFGEIGRKVAGLAVAFGMEVAVHTRHPDRYREDPAAQSVRFVDLDTLFRSADVLSLHCPLTPETGNLVDAGRLAQMKPGGFLINTGRGPLIDEAALAEALNGGRIAGAGLDVLSAEPPLPDNPLLRAKNCIITPHIAWATRAARGRLLTEAARNIEAFLRDEPRNMVN